jgi:hypothetical protein
MVVAQMDGTEEEEAAVTVDAASLQTKITFGNDRNCSLMKYK